MADGSRTGASFDRANSRQDYATPRGFLEAVELRFGPIAWDLAATLENEASWRDEFAEVGGVREAGTGREDYFGPDHPQPEYRDALANEWDMLGTLWLNPPFGNIAPWAEKCAKYRDRADWLLFLVPASVGSNWFQDHVVPNAHVLELSPRMSFDGKNPFPKDLVLACFGFGMTGRSRWSWK